MKVFPARNLQTGIANFTCYDFEAFLPTRTYFNCLPRKIIITDNYYC